MVKNKVGAYSWSIKTGLPVGYTIYKTDEDIPLYDITEPKNKKVLINLIHLHSGKTIEAVGMTDI